MFDKTTGTGTMSIDRHTLEGLFAQHVPSSATIWQEEEDEAMGDYLYQMLCSWLEEHEGGPEPRKEDMDQLVDTLTPFLSGGEGMHCIRALVRDMVAARQGGSGSTTTLTQQRPMAAPVRLMDALRIEEATTTPTSQAETEEPLATTQTALDNGHHKNVESPERKSRSQGKLKKQQHSKKTQPSAPLEVTTEASNGNSRDENGDQTFLEDEASAWQECLDSQQVWGGRGRGGRGEYAGAVNSVHSNIHLSNVSIALENGLELLQNATIDITKGHRYGLIGRNGVGKSSLLRRLARKAIPGMPHDLRVLLVQQQIQGSTTQTALQVLVEADQQRTKLLKQQEQFEKAMELLTDTDQLAAAAEQLSFVATELEALGADTTEQRALEILQGLQFRADMIHGPTINLSGGWRMRLALARALLVSSDLLLFDECTNHLDLFGLNWLIEYLNQEDSGRTLIVVSHDRAFLDAVCTDIIVMEHQQLKYHVGNYSAYLRQQEEKASREAQILDAAERQRTKAQAFVQKQQSMANKKSADPNKQRQAKMIKEKKMDRIGNYREDGKRYKLNSLKKLSEDHVRLAQKVVIELDEPVVRMHFPNPTWPPGILENQPIFRMEDFSFSFVEGPNLLNQVTVSLQRGSKVALVGKNGAGKTTLVKLISGETNPKDFRSSGEIWLHPNIRIGHVTQYTVEELEVFVDKTVVEYAEEKLMAGKASSNIVAKASGNVRQYLGAFGLGGKHAHCKIGTLSGGERMRLCFATVLADEPHLLLLDESTNHVDLETLDSMSSALKEYEGSVLMVSHNQAFLSGFCQELWVLENGTLTVTHSDTETFDEIFSEYRNSIMNTGGARLSAQRREKADRAKRATQQRAGARQNTALL